MSRDRRKKVLRVVTRVLRCEYCRQTWGDDIYERHILQCSENPSNSITCYLCNKSVLSSDRDRHIKTCSRESETPERSRDRLGNPI